MYQQVKTQNNYYVRYHLKSTYLIYAIACRTMTNAPYEIYSWLWLSITLSGADLQSTSAKLVQTDCRGSPSRKLTQLLMAALCFCFLTDGRQQCFCDEHTRMSCNDIISNDVSQISDDHLPNGAHHATRLHATTNVNESWRAVFRIDMMTSKRCFSISIFTQIWLTA